MDNTLEGSNTIFMTYNITLSTLKDEWKLRMFKKTPLIWTKQGENVENYLISRMLGRLKNKYKV
jgi:hypothetical protein